MAWFKGNIANQKTSEPEIRDIFDKTIEYLEANEDIVLMTGVYLYLAKEHDISQQSVSHWTCNMYKDNISIGRLWAVIKLIIEDRLVKVTDNDALRPNIQAMVLQNKHNYRDKQDLKHSGEIKGTVLKIVNNDQGNKDYADRPDKPKAASGSE